MECIEKSMETNICIRRVAPFVVALKLLQVRSTDGVEDIRGAVDFTVFAAKKAVAGDSNG